MIKNNKKEPKQITIEQWNAWKTPNGIKLPINDTGDSDQKNLGISSIVDNIPFDLGIENAEIIWRTCFDVDDPNIVTDTTFSIFPYDDSGFYNPTDNNPMKASLFLNYHMIPDIVRQILNDRYRNLEHYHKNIEAMFKTLVFQRIKRIRYYPRVERHLKGYIEDAELLGFPRDDNDIFDTPDDKTLGHFENKRLGIKGMEKIRDAYIISLKEDLAKYGYTLGETVSVDSTPLTALSKDPDARYNTHYDKLMYKVHFVVDVVTSVPLFVMVTSGTEYDGHYLIPMLKKLRSLGIYPKEIYADDHYDTLENWAIVSVKHNAKLQIDLAENTIFRDDGKHENLQKEYQRLHHNVDFRPQDRIGFDEMCQYLLENGKYDCVGAYFRNRWYLEWKKHKMEIEKSGEREKKPRSKSEGVHGHIKENMMFDVFMDGRGMRYAERHVNMMIISLLAVALTRVQHGILDGLTKIACLT